MCAVCEAKKNLIEIIFGVRDFRNVPPMLSNIGGFRVGLLSYLNLLGLTRIPASMQKLSILSNRTVSISSSVEFNFVVEIQNDLWISLHNILII